MGSPMPDPYHNMDPSFSPPSQHPRSQRASGSPAMMAQETIPSSSVGDTGSVTGPDSDKQSGNTKTARRRTKTGCLTCRKRRIKCGEERPICSNCIKSKRQCEGYNQRVVFKDGMNGLFRAGAIGGMDRRYNHPFIQPAPGPQLQPLAPAPPSHSQPMDPLDTTLAPHLRRMYEERRNEPPRSSPIPGIGPIIDDHQGHDLQPEYPAEYGSQHQDLSPHKDEFSVFYQAVPGSATASSFTVPQSSPTTDLNSATLYAPSPYQGAQLPLHHYAGPPATSAYVPSHPSVAQSGSSSCPFNPPLPNSYAVVSQRTERGLQPAQEFSAAFSRNSDLLTAPPSLSSPGDGSPAGNQYINPEEVIARMAQNVEIDYDYDDESEEEYDDMEEDDPEELGEGEGYYDIAQQEQYTVTDPIIQDPYSIADSCPPPGVVDNAARAQITKFIQPHTGHLTEQTRISFRSFLPSTNELTTYQPSLSQSPLMNPATARIFCHFIFVLGPSISIFERYPPNPQATFTPGSANTGPQNVWSYTIPMMSLQHPPLLHALLALSALHISRLTRGPEHPHLLHYNIATRRLRKAIESEKHQMHVATLSATLMLAYYESMAAEHDKWSSHIHGAKMLLKSVDFAKVSKRIEVMDEEDEARAKGKEPVREQQEPQSQPQPQQQQQPSLLALRKMQRQNRNALGNRPDDELTSYMIGGRARNTSSAHRRQHRPANDPTEASNKMEEGNLQLQADMFWWFVKMDAYQSILSGCPLVLDYVHWSQCPPRARIGTLGTICGASDHFFLLLGRLADFNARDTKRKRAVAAATGGVWIPPPEFGGPPGGPFAAAMGMGRGGPPGGGPPQGMGGPPPGTGPPPAPPPSEPKVRGRGRAAPPKYPGMNAPFSAAPPPPPKPAQEPMVGMMPQPQIKLPKAFAEAMQPTPPPPAASYPPQPPPPPTTIPELVAWTKAAEEEWTSIKDALELFFTNLGPEYQPLPLEYMPASPTPFGPAMYYRTYSVAVLQMLYRTALLVLHRCHPSMPPIAMMAMGIAARKTASTAIEVGRIMASLVPTDPNAQINPSLGAALIESSLPIFFAAVQYQDPKQREWVVKKCREIHRLTGWATASRVLLGCQRAWERAAEMGKGPDYERPPLEEEEDIYWTYYDRVERDREQQRLAMGGEGGGRFVWNLNGKRAVDATGVLGEASEVVRGLLSGLKV